MAPVAGRHYAALDADGETAVVTDAGGTSYDVSARAPRRRSRWTRETWLGAALTGHITGFPSVDVKQHRRRRRQHRVGRRRAACCTSGPQSAGADPGPRATAAAGRRPTVTDACVVLGYLDPDYFLGGAMELDPDARARRDPGRRPARSASTRSRRPRRSACSPPSGWSQAIEEITVDQGIDPTRGAGRRRRRRRA